MGVKGILRIDRIYRGLYTAWRIDQPLSPPATLSNGRLILKGEDLDSKRIDWRAPLGGFLIAAALAMLVWGIRSGRLPGSGIRPVATAAAPSPPRTPDPLVPTALPPAARTAAIVTRSAITPTRSIWQAGTQTGVSTVPRLTRPAPTLAPAPDTPASPPVVVAPPDRNLPAAEAISRIGVGLPLRKTITDYPWEEKWPGWYLDWQVSLNPALPGHVRFAQMVRLQGDAFRPDLETILAAARAHPGSLWLIGNEPDVAWQDNITPEQYATTYQALYVALKTADAGARIAIGGISQPTPLRMAYLDRILAAYRSQFGTEMPVDVWNIHAFILREERDSWGIGIPPGMTVNEGQLYEIDAHADMAVFRGQIEDFRGWMADRGLRDRPLIVSEYGILMPESYGFPVAQVSQFMVDTFDYLLTASDETTGYPRDDNRLVQAFCWYSVADTEYPTSNLFDPESREITPVGETFTEYVKALK